MVSLKRKEPKLNTIYPITKEDSITSIDCRINFTIIDFIYESLLKKCGKKKVDYHYRLYEFLNVGESYYEKLKSGLKIDIIKNEKNDRYVYVKINNLINGSCKLEIIGVSQKQWKRYFGIIKKIKQLKKEKADRKYIAEAERRKKNFKEMVLMKIDNKEMNREAIEIYTKMGNYLFQDKLGEQSRKKADKHVKYLRQLTISDLEMLYQVDKQKYQELYYLFASYVKTMCDIKKR